MIGLIIVISSIFVLRNEINRAYVKRSQIVEQAKVYQHTDLFVMLENLEITFQEMNNSFYDIVSDLEGNISLNRKEIEDIQMAIEEIKRKQLAIYNDVNLHVSKESKQHADVVKNLRHMAKIKEDKTQTEVKTEAKSESKTEPKTEFKSDVYKLENITEMASNDFLKEENEQSQVNARSISNDTNPNTSESKAFIMSQIVLLRSQGYSLTEIAKQLGIGMGEIKLLIRMNDKK
jgi:hypothetical protein